MKGITANVQYFSEYVGVTFNGTLSVSKREDFINLSLCRDAAVFSPIVNNAIRSHDKANFCSLASKDRLVGHVYRSFGRTRAQANL